MGPFLRRVAFQARTGRADPGGVGPILIVGPFEWIPYRTYLRMVQTAFEGTRFHLVDTTYKRGQVIDLSRLAQRAFGPQADPIVFFLAGPWIGNSENRLVNYEGFRKLLDVEDQKVDKQFKVMLRPHGFQGVLYRYESDEMDRLRTLTAPLGVRYYYWPHHVDPDEHRDWGLPKIYDICLYGTLHPDTYPLRHRVHRLLTEHPGSLRVRIVRRDEGIEGPALSRVINQSWLTFADTTGKMDRFLARFVEIPASGSCIVGGIPTRHRDLFRGRVVELDMGMRDEAILGAIHTALADRDRLSRMTASLRADVLQRYSLERSRDAFWAILREFARIPGRGPEPAR